VIFINFRSRYRLADAENVQMYRHNPAMALFTDRLVYEGWNAELVHSARGVVALRGVALHGDWLYYCYSVYMGQGDERLAIERVCQDGNVQGVALLLNIEGRVDSFHVTNEGNFIFLFRRTSRHHQYQNLVYVKYDKNGNILNQYTLSNVASETVACTLFSNCGKLIIRTYVNGRNVIHIVDENGGLVEALDVYYGHLLLTAEGRVLYLELTRRGSIEINATIAALKRLWEINIQTGVLSQATEEEMLWYGITNLFSDDDYARVASMYIAPQHSPFDIYVYLTCETMEPPSGMYGFCFTTGELSAVSTVVGWESVNIKWLLCIGYFINAFPTGRIAVLSPDRDSTNIQIFTHPDKAALNHSGPTHIQWVDEDPRAIFTTQNRVDGARWSKNWIYFWYALRHIGGPVSQTITIGRVDPSGVEHHSVTIKWSQEDRIAVKDVSITTYGTFLVLTSTTYSSNADVTMRLSEFDAYGNLIAHHSSSTYRNICNQIAHSFITNEGGFVFIGAHRRRGRGAITGRSIFVVDRDGTAIGTIDMYKVSRLYQTKCGRILARAGETLWDIDLQTGELGETVYDGFWHPISSRQWAADGSTPFDFTTGARTSLTQLYGFDINTKEWTLLIDRDKSEFDASIITYVYLTDGRVAVFYPVDMGTYRGAAIIIIDF